ncbi:hypothetical protein [Burkholderia territorii]|uniref:hypothetical protein n=1 Tax=Burkholderia territorii TaxID=1503055 RepID=UPI0012D95096|nr:hypothetical protein [Burkholderia territorii]
MMSAEGGHNDARTIGDNADGMRLPGSPIPHLRRRRTDHVRRAGGALNGGWNGSPQQTLDVAKQQVVVKVAPVSAALIRIG